MAQTHSLDLELSSSQYASIADASQTGLDITGNISVEAWVKFESVATTQYIYNKGGDSAATGGFKFYWSTTNGLASDWYSGGVGEFSRVKTPFTPVAGKWYHLACAIQPAAASSSRFYIDGKEITPTVDASDAASIANNNKNARVGATEDSVGAVSGYLDGLIKDVRVFSDIRTATEIRTDARTQSVTDANLEAEWNFNNVYTDASGNGNTLTSSGSPVFSTDIPWEEATQVNGSTYLETNLVSFWTMDEASGTRVDSHGVNDLTDNNTVLSATGILSDAADLEDANSEYLDISDASQVGLDFTGDFSLSLWIKPESLTTTHYITMKGDQGASGIWYGMFLDNTGVLTFLVDDGTTAYLAASPSSAITAGSLYHVVGVRMGAIIYLYINGVLITSTSAVSTSMASTLAFRIGNRYAAGVLGAYYDGLVDEYSAYDRALHYGDILDHYNQGVGITYDITVARQPRAGVAMSGSFMMV